jgi:predicted lipid-binding transport protein (Tim44 family)
MSRFIGELNIALFPMIALALFLLAFAIIAMQVFFPSRGRRQQLQHMASAPLADDHREPAATSARTQV